MKTEKKQHPSVTKGAASSLLLAVRYEVRLARRRGMDASNIAGVLRRVLRDLDQSAALSTQDTEARND